MGSLAPVLAARAVDVAGWRVIVRIAATLPNAGFVGILFIEAMHRAVGAGHEIQPAGGDLFGAQLTALGTVGRLLILRQGAHLVKGSALQADIGI